MMKIFGKKFNDKKLNKFLLYAVFGIVAVWFVYRFIMVAAESRMTVFNPARAAAENGVPVSTIVAARRDGFIKVPIVVRDNKALVSNARYSMLAAGQKMDAGEIVSVSRNLDFDTGMHIVKTRGAVDGINFVQIKQNGYFIPAYAMRDGVLMVVDDTVAEKREIETCGQDADFVCVASGISDGDIVILSKVAAGQKVKIQK